MLRTALQARRDLRIDEIPRSIEILPRVTGCTPRPDVLLVAADRSGISLPRLAQHLHTAGLTSKVIVIGPQDMLDGDTLVALLNLGVPGYLTWEGMDPVALLRSIATVLVGEVVVSPPVLAALYAALDRRQTPREERLVLAPQERVVHTTRVAGSSIKVRATLWAENPDLTVALPFLFAHIGVTVDIVTSASALLEAAAHARSGDFLVIDCATVPDASARCTTVVTQTAVPVYVCHPFKEFVDALRERKGAACGDLHWLPTSWTGLLVLELGRTLIAPAPEVESPQPSAPLTHREQEVYQLVALGLSNGMIGERLSISRGTVKTDVARIKDKLNLTMRSDLITAYHSLRE